MMSFGHFHETPPIAMLVIDACITVYSGVVKFQPSERPRLVRGDKNGQGYKYAHK
ncbi:hypothetical protein DPMN_038433 [Dreissena polymorpha]|uniref:Uncharacterized protein n=1 Tax=Dreissena polymorpha TaxID=45954 RepID=A0A9D4MFE2_DREPO|nr:hypothetical protein DPMN_038433 [Dreissena polymorpha]